MLYKLDGGLDHILVDEAQDTSPVQWQVIRALAEEFFSGAGASEAVRTLFAVGDEKQSIYGFQGAAPKMFARTGESFARAPGARGMPWRRVPLTLSFRAVEPLLAAVDRIFADAGAHAGRRRFARADRARRASGGPRRPGGDLADREARSSPSSAEPWSPLAETGTTPAGGAARRAHRPDHRRLARVGRETGSRRTARCAPAIS